jgi:excisionase family DNA binding protein
MTVMNDAGSESTEENLWDADRAGAYLGLSRCTVLRKARRGSIPYRKLEGGAVRFVPSEIRRWADGQPGPRFGKNQQGSAA